MTCFHVDIVVEFSDKGLNFRTLEKHGVGYGVNVLLDIFVLKKNGKRPCFELLIQYVTGLTRLFARIQIFSNRKRISIHDNSFEKYIIDNQKFRVPEKYNYIDSRSFKVISIAHSQRNIYVCEDVSIDAYYGNIFTNRHEMIVEGTIWGEHFMHDFKWPIPRKLYSSKISGEKRINLLLPSSPFYHFLLEDFPAFLETRSQFPTAEIVVWKYANKYVFDCLEILQVPFRKIDRFFVNTNLVFPEKSKTLAPSYQDVETLQNFFSKISNETNIIPNKKVFVSRIKDSRSPKFESKLINKLVESKEWIIFEATNMTILDQLKLIRQTKILAGVHGAGLSWITALQKGAKVFEIGPSKMNCFQQLANICKVDYEELQLREEGESDFEVILQRLLS